MSARYEFDEPSVNVYYLNESVLHSTVVEMRWKLCQENPSLIQSYYGISYTTGA